MDTNYNSDILNTIYLENIENYVVINEEIYKNIISSIQYNYLLILFTMSCFTLPYHSHISTYGLNSTSRLSADFFWGRFLL